MLGCHVAVKFRSNIRRRPVSFLILIPITFMFINVCVYYWKTDIPGRVSLDTLKMNTGRRKLLVKTNGDENCSKPAVMEFPELKFPGGKFGEMVTPFVASIYLYILLARVCDIYFINSIKIICSKIGISGDVAGATLMAAATSSPELFVNMVGTFITNGNIGTGTIIGSAVFNNLAVPGLCSFFAATKVIKLDWWPLTRDSIAYCISLFILCMVLRDGTVQWYEALFLVISYAGYLTFMRYSGKVRDFLDSGNDNNNKLLEPEVWDDQTLWPLLKTKQENCNVHYYSCRTEDNEFAENSDFEGFSEEREGCFWPGSNSSIICKIWWLFTIPITIILACTVPNSKTRPKLYMLTFSICVCWIAVGSYLIAWMISISGYILRIPDSVMGLTFIAAGMCIPETISSIIVSKQGHGSMALANALGSNVFDTLFCFGVPWLLKTTYFAENGKYYLDVDKARLEYDTLILLITLFILFTVVAINKFHLTRFGGYTCLIMYLVFIGISVTVELYAHLASNAMPMCNMDT